MNQSDGSECWTWLSPGCPPALHTMSPERLWEQGLCLLPAAWEATTTSGGHQALAQPWAKTLAQLSSSLRQDPSQPSQTWGKWATARRGALAHLYSLPQTWHRARGIAWSPSCSRLGLTQGCIHLGLGN